MSSPRSCSLRGREAGQAGGRQVPGTRCRGPPRGFSEFEPGSTESIPSCRACRSSRRTYRDHTPTPPPFGQCWGLVPEARGESLPEGEFSRGSSPGVPCAGASPRVSPGVGVKEQSSHLPGGAEAERVETDTEFGVQLPERVPGSHDSLYNATEPRFSARPCSDSPLTSCPPPPAPPTRLRSWDTSSRRPPGIPSPVCDPGPTPHPPLIRSTSLPSSRHLVSA